MEADGAVEEPMEISAKPDSDNHGDVVHEQESEPKVNGTKLDIHEEIHLDTVKIEAESVSESESENDLKEVEPTDPLGGNIHDNEIVDNGSNENSQDFETVETLGEESVDIQDEYEENGTEDQKHDDVEDNSNTVDRSEDVHEVSNDVPNSQDEDNESDDPMISETIAIDDSTEDVNKEVNDDVNTDEQDNMESAAVVSKIIVAAEPKPVEKMQLRRSSRGIKRKRYDDEGPEFEERKTVAVNKNKSPNKPIMQRHILNSSANIPNLYQKVLGPNTTLTPISVKNKNITIKNVQIVPQPAILPSLTDDMFVVEAPSFIVPYVYEKPPIEPLKEYIEKLRKQIAEEKVKAEVETKEGEENDSQSSKANGQEIDDSDSELKGVSELEELIQTDEKKNEDPGKKARRKNKDDDESWDEGSSSDSIDDTDDKESTQAAANKSKKVDYFDLTLGKFFSKIGLNLVKRYVQNDLLKQQNKKLSREKRSGQISKATQLSILSLKKNIAVSDKKIAPYILEQHKCQFCMFKSESRLALAHHLETPHMKNNMYSCNFCKFEVKSPHDILYHMEKEHCVRAKMERPLSYHQCPNCPFEDNGKGKLARHQIACAKRFKPNLNLSPPFEWEPPAKILTARAKAPIMNPYQYSFNRAPITNNHIGKPIINSIIPGANNFRARLRAPIPIPRANTVQGISILRGGATIRPSIPSSAFMQSNFASGSKPKISNQPSISITPLPRQVIQRPAPKDACVICEICDGYIKDLEQLRSHMQWIHRVKIHPKMMTNSPPLNCQKCQLRFFTDQGLERHLLGSHGLVTKSMQEEANKGNDGGRCPICGRVYQWKLLDHVGRDHKMALKPAHLSYKCTVCSAIFGLYKQFENHVYSAHSVVAKRVMNKGKSLPQANKIGNSILKPLRNREDLTITPSSGRAIVSSDEEK